MVTIRSVGQTMPWPQCWVPSSGEYLSVRSRRFVHIIQFTLNLCIKKMPGNNFQVVSGPRVDLVGGKTMNMTMMKTIIAMFRW